MALPRNTQEIFALQRFQRIIKDLNLDQGTIMRFLRARNLDLDHAEEMIRAYANWRKNNIYETAVSDWKLPVKAMMQFEVFHCGLDTEGRPVYYINFLKWLPSRNLYTEFEPFDLILLAYQTFISLYEEIEKSQHQQIVAIVDNEGIGFTKIFQEVHEWTGVQTLIDVWELYEKNFPETLHKAFFLNTARAFMWGFNLLKPFMTKHTLSKISIFGTDEDKWKPAIQEFIPIEAIPKKFGGIAELNNVYDVVYDGFIQKLNLKNL